MDHRGASVSGLGGSVEMSSPSQRGGGTSSPPPTRGNRPSGVGAAIASNSALSELVKELDRTRKEYSRSILQLNQLQSTVQSLQEEVDDKDGRISDLEKQLKDIEENNKVRHRESEEKHVATGTALAHRARHLEVEIQRLQRENESMSKLESDNSSLRETILDSQATIERLQLANQDLLQRMKDGGGGGGRGAQRGDHVSGHETRGAPSNAYEDMEAQFQKKLAAAEKKFRAEAYKALSEEAKSALQGNDHLQVVLKRQNDSIEMVLGRCRQLEGAHDEVLRQNEEAGENLNLHVREVQKLTRALEETRQKNRLLDEAMKQRKVERASLELLYVEYEQQKKKLQQSEERAKRSAREAARWQDRAVQLTNELSDDQRLVAERKLLQLQGMSNTIEDNARREELRMDAKKRAQKRQQDGARTLRAITGEQGGAMSSSVGGGIGGELAMYRSSNGGNIEESVSRQMGIGTEDIMALWKATDHHRVDEAELGHLVLEERRLAALATATPTGDVEEQGGDGDNNTNPQQQHQSSASYPQQQSVSTNPYPQPPPIVSTADIRRQVNRSHGPRSVADEVAERNKQLSRSLGPRGGGGSSSANNNNTLPRMVPTTGQQSPQSANPRYSLDSLSEARRTIKAAPLPAGARHYAVPPVRKTEEYIKLIGRTENNTPKDV